MKNLIVYWGEKRYFAPLPFPNIGGHVPPLESPPMNNIEILDRTGSNRRQPHFM